MRYLTIKQLIKAGACEEKVRLFKKLHGDRCAVTVKRTVAEWDRWNWDWASEYLLSAPALKVYDKAKATALKVYDKAKAPAWEAYNKATATAWEVYNKATATAWAKAYLRDRGADEK